MQLFSSIHTISLRVNNLAAHPASFLCFGKAVSMVTPAVWNGTHPGRKITRSPVGRGGALRHRAQNAGRRDWLRQGAAPQRERERDAVGDAGRAGHSAVGDRQNGPLQTAAVFSLAAHQETPL